MIFLKWAALAIIDILLLITVPFAAPVIAAMYGAQPHGLDKYTWGWMWGTYDNPPQGDEGFVRKRAMFPGLITGWQGYVNRVHWMIRNNLYGFARWWAIDYREGDTIQVIGRQNISDKGKIPGWYFVAVFDDAWKMRGFEFYCVLPWFADDKVIKLWRWSFTIKARDLRVRLGWKILTDKFKGTGFAPLVNTCNPFDGYGNS